MRVRAAHEGRAEEPARRRSPPQHVLLALQQGAGNQAVTRMLARQLVKDNMRSGAAKRLSAAHKGATSEDALLLAMYNDMQSKVRPAPPAPWATVDAAITALKAAGKIDDADVPLFKADARKARLPPVVLIWYTSGPKGPISRGDTWHYACERSAPRCS